ncbi:MAG: alpha/beta hydrolase [Bryobacterales bacterium]|nr:alpha/beta hydrolase [Bryobacterales bacterium]
MRTAVASIWLSLGILAAQQPPATPALPAGVTVEQNIAYAEFPETKLDVFKPAGWRASGKPKHPGILVIHGGGWTGGVKESRVQAWVLPYLEKGFVVVNVEYRLAKAATAPAAVEDVLKAANWFTKNAKRLNVDRKRIAVTGDSAGGHLSLMVGLTSKQAKLGKPAKVAAVVNFYGITDVGDQLQGPNMRQYAVTWVPEQDGRFTLADRVSPKTYVRRGLPPVLTIHGDQDPTVPYEHGAKITKALRDAGNDAEMITIPGGKHGFPPDKMKEIYVQIFEFLSRRGVIQ